MGFLNSLFGGAPTKYDAQKYFDYAEKQQAKGNIVEALNYYAKVINHGDLGVKPFVPYIELCMEHDEWEKLPACIKVYRKRFPKENSGWIDKIEKETIEQLRGQGLFPIEVKEQQNPEAPKICPPNPKTADSPKDEKKEQQKKPFILTFPTSIKHPTLGERYDEYCASLPPFDFYEGDNEDKIPADADMEISDYLNRLADTLAYCRDVAKKQGFVAAEQYYLFLIGHHPWEPDAYDELLELYRNNGKNDAFEALRLYSIDHFSKRRERMERQLTALAEQQGVKEMATEAIRKGEKVSYFRGLFTLYDPFPCIEHWKRLMPIFSDSE